MQWEFPFEKRDAGGIWHRSGLFGACRAPAPVSQIRPAGEWTPRGCCHMGRRNRWRRRRGAIWKYWGSPSGYILMSSQSFETDVPTANIKAVYRADRRVSP